MLARAPPGFTDDRATVGGSVLFGLLFVWGEIELSGIGELLDGVCRHRARGPCPHHHVEVAAGVQEDGAGRSGDQPVYQVAPMLITFPVARFTPA